MSIGGVGETMRILPLQEVRPPCTLWEESNNVSPVIKLRKLGLGLWIGKRRSESHDEVGRLKKQMDVLKEQVQQTAKKDDRGVKSIDVRVRSPFVKKVLEFAMPSKLKLPVVEPYYGKTDPREHVETFVMFMQLHGVVDYILCRTR